MAIAHVQSTGFANVSPTTAEVPSSASTTASKAFASNVTAGNLIVVGIYLGAVYSDVSVTDTLGNSYKQVAAQGQATDAHSIRIFWAYSPSGGANTVTATFASVGFRHISIHEYSGFDATVSCDKSASASADGSTALNSGATLTTQVSDSLLFVIGGSSGASASSWTAGLNYTKRVETRSDGPTNLITLVSEDRVVSSTGAYTGTMTAAANENWSCAIAVFWASAPAGIGDGPRFVPYLAS